MTAWRMAFRAGTGGEEMFPNCLRLGVAAITYVPLAEVDLSKYPPNEPRGSWAQLAASQKYSLRKVAYDMQKGDVIYAKQGPWIVRKGIVKGSYQFDSEYRIIDHNHVPWAHQVPVDWLSDFVEVKIALGDQQIWAVRELSEYDVRKVEREEQRVRIKEQIERKRQSR